MNQLVEETAVLQPPHPISPCSNQPSQCPAHVLPNTAAMGLGHSEGWAQAMLFVALQQCLEDAAKCPSVTFRVWGDPQDLRQIQSR